MNANCGPKTLAERLDWMAKNLPGFADELAAVETIRRAALENKLTPSKRDSESHTNSKNIKKASK